MVAHLQRGDNLVAVVLGGDGVPHDSVGVDDRVPLLPADDDGPLTPCRAVELLRVTLDGDGGVGVGSDHGWDWEGEELQEAPVKGKAGLGEGHVPGAEAPPPRPLPTERLQG